MGNRDEVTLRDIYDAVSKLEEKMDRRMGCLQTDIADRISKVEIRTDSLESFRDNMMGKIAIITVIATSVVSLIFAFVKDLLSKKI